jgi:hypothetical protein
MRLKRDSQGNYSYEYTADQDSVAEAQKDLAAAQNDLYNFDKERYNSNLDDMLGAWQDFQSDYKDIVLDISLTEEERVERLALLREQYGEYINGKTAENEVIRQNLTSSAFMNIASMYDKNSKEYQMMINGEKDALMNDLIPTWDSGVQQMINKFSGEDGFEGAVSGTFDTITEKTKDYVKVTFSDKVDGANIFKASMKYTTEIKLTSTGLRAYLHVLLVNDSEEEIVLDMEDY